MITRNSRATFVKQFSHRSVPEQLVGLGIYLIISLGFGIISQFAPSFPLLFYSVFIALGIWSVWRRFSLRVLKLELSLFIAQFLLQVLWGLSFYLLQEPLLVLVALLLLSSNTLLALVLFWKKEKLSGILYVLPLLWLAYLSCVNMISCISNP